LAGQRLLDLGDMCLVTIEELERGISCKRCIGKDTRAMMTKGRVMRD
jgi:hypothetical protein